MTKLKQVVKNRVFQNRKSLKTITIFVLMVISLNLAVWHFGKSGYLYFFELFIANIAVWIIRLFGIRALISGTTISLAHETWLINAECTALFLAITFTSFVLAYPACIRDKAIALEIGIPLIFGTNIVRLLILAWLTELKSPYTRFFHDYVWQVGFILMVVVFWHFWVDTVVSHGKKVVISS